MTAAASPSPRKVRLWIGVGLLVAVLLGGALVTQRAPGLVAPPLLAETPVRLPDGTTIRVQRYEVTVAEWNRCHAAGACALALRAPRGADPSQTPATGLSQPDVQAYIVWLNAATGADYRLPTLAEWEHMAAPVMPETPDPIFTDPALSWASAYLIENTTPRALRPQGSFSVTPECIADLDGSVWEWTADCYAGAAGPVDPARCPAFWMGGEHVAAMSYLVRDPARGGCAVGTPPAHLGLRLVLDEAA